MPSIADLRLEPETAAHDAAIAALCDEAFGPGRYARAAERVRERAGHDRTLSFVAVVGGEVLGSVRQSRVRIGAQPALMLGPLVVRPAVKGLGIGRALMARAAEAGRDASEAAAVLVGDRAYYVPLGYRPLPENAVRMPGPVDPRRVLALALAPGGIDRLAGSVVPR